MEISSVNGIEWGSQISEKPPVISTKTYKVLTFDGGGVRGAFTAQIIAMLEDELHFLKHVDFFVGTSTGSILACGLAYGIDPNQIVKFYHDKARDIFGDENQKNRIKKEISELLKRKARYQTKNMKDALLEVFPENLLLADLPKKVLCISFDLFNPSYNNWTPALIDNFENSKVSVVDAILRSSAAPSYFSSYQGYIDGGVIANNPSMMAFARALDEKGANQNISNIKLLSLGTGLTTAYISKDVDWGIMDWVFHPSLDLNIPTTPLLDIIMDGTVSVPHFQCLKILGSNYFRINPFLYSDVSLDDYTKMSELIEEAKRLKGTEDWENLIQWVKDNFLS